MGALCEVSRCPSLLIVFSMQQMELNSLTTHSANRSAGPGHLRRKMTNHITLSDPYLHLFSCNPPRALGHTLLGSFPAHQNLNFPSIVAGRECVSCQPSCNQLEIIIASTSCLQMRLLLILTGRYRDLFMISMEIIMIAINSVVMFQSEIFALVRPHAIHHQYS